MFYAANSKIISTSWTHLDPLKVFSGQYWDEFGLTAHLVPDNANVLLLGLARGGGIRPILSSAKNLKLTAVDLDAGLSEECKKHFQSDFPQLSFEAIHADAEDFMAQNELKFDCIWLDLYSETSYCPLYFDQDFLRSIKNSLTSHGVLLVNAYGLPNQFSPLARGGTQAAHLAALQKEFAFTAAIPYRRNLTMVAGNSRPQIYPAQQNSALNARDAQTLSSMALRLQNLHPASPVDLNIPTDLSLRNVDQQMLSLWPEVVREIRGLGQAITSPLEILTLLEDGIAGPRLLTAALNQSKTILMVFPILAASEIHLRKVEVNWLYEWLFTNAGALKAQHPEIYRSIWLTQLWAAILHSPGTLSGCETPLWNLIQRELA